MYGRNQSVRIGDGEPGHSAPRTLFRLEPAFAKMPATEAN